MLVDFGNAQYRWPLPSFHEPHLDAHNSSRWVTGIWKRIALTTALALVSRWGCSDRPLTHLTISSLLHGVGGTILSWISSSCSCIFDNLLWVVVRWRTAGVKVEQASDIGFLAKMMIQQYVQKTQTNPTHPLSCLKVLVRRTLATP